MNRALTLIPIVVIFTTGFLISTPKSASAFCVYNKAAFSVDGIDTRKGDLGFLSKKWEKKSLAPGDKNCCPGKKKECQGATIKVTGEKNSSCQAGVDAHGWIVIHSISTPNGLKLNCNVNERL